MTFGALMRTSLIYTIGSVVPRVGVFLLLPIYTLGMGPAEFGVLSLMLSLAGLLTILYRLGLDGALLRFHFDVSGRRTAALYWTMATLTLVAGVILSALLVTIAGPVFSEVFAGVPIAPYGWLAAGIAVLTALQFVPTTWFRAMDRPLRVLGFGFLTFAIGAITTLWLVLVLHLGAVGGLLGQLASGLVVLAVTVALLVRRRPAAIDRELAAEGLRFGLPLVPHALAGWALNLSDRWVISLTIGLSVAATQEQVGIYSLGYQLGQVVGIVATALNMGWVPFFYARGNDERGPRLLREMTTLVVGGIAVLAVFVGALAGEAVAVLAPPSWGPDAGTATRVAALVALACLVQGFYYMAVSPVFLQRRTAGLPVITTGAAALNIALNIALIPRIGIVGAAWSTIAGYGAIAALTVWYARRSYQLVVDWRRVSAVFGIVAVADILASAARPDGLLASGTIHLAIAVIAASAIGALVFQPLRRARLLVEQASVVDVPTDVAMSS